MALEVLVEVTVRIASEEPLPCCSLVKGFHGATTGVYLSLIHISYRLLARQMTR